MSLSDENLQLSFDEYINKVKNEAEKYAKESRDRLKMTTEIGPNGDLN